MLTPPNVERAIFSDGGPVDNVLKPLRHCDEEDVMALSALSCCLGTGRTILKADGCGQPLAFADGHHR
ncbi:MAG: hypothetical protein U0936_20740 [Planctomycetaceae bacterium]